jgi:hypothetical protein
MTRHDDLGLALLHLQTAQRLLRASFALGPLVVVNKAIRLTDAMLSQNRPAQPRLALEADEQPRTA